MKYASLFCGLSLLGLACGDSSSSDGFTISFGGAGSASRFDTTEVAPSSNYQVLVRFPSGPAGLTVQPSNNNLDVTQFQGRTFMAWRTGPTHFASTDSQILVVSEGPEGWRAEGSFSEGTDLREPRLLAMGDRLFLYFALLGTDPTAFDPHGTVVTEYHPAASADAGGSGGGSAGGAGGAGSTGGDHPLWDEPALLDLGDTFIPWHTKMVGDTAYLIGYDGGENIYDFNGDPIHIRFLTTTDGHHFTPAFPDQPVAFSGGSSETDFALLDDGSLVSVSRNEAGDAINGFGSLICRGPASDPGKLSCRADKKKYDSPLVFRQGETVYLVGRRNVTPDGNFDLGVPLLPLQARAVLYNTTYSGLPKRCSLWKVDPATQEVSWVQDLPSRGDTCYTAMTRKDDHTITIYNYTSPLEEAVDCPAWPTDCADPSWIEGQLLPTNIYRIDLTLP